MWVVTLSIFSSFMMEPESSLCTLSGMCTSTTYMYMYLHACTFCLQSQYSLCVCVDLHAVGSGGCCVWGYSVGSASFRSSMRNSATASPQICLHLYVKSCYIAYVIAYHVQACVVSALIALLKTSFSIWHTKGLHHFIYTHTKTGNT